MDYFTDDSGSDVESSVSSEGGAQGGEPDAPPAGEQVLTGHGAHAGEQNVPANLAC